MSAEEGAVREAPPGREQVGRTTGMPIEGGAGHTPDPSLASEPGESTGNGLGATSAREPRPREAASPSAPIPGVTAIVYSPTGSPVRGLEATISALTEALSARVGTWEVFLLGAAGWERGGGAEKGPTRGGSSPSVSVGKGDIRHLPALESSSPVDYVALLSQALALARYPLVLQVEVGFPLSAGCLDEMLALMGECHIVVGRRHRSRRLRCPSFSRALHWFIFRVLFGIPLEETTPPVRLYRREIFRRICIQSRGRFADVEVLAKAGFYGMVLGEAALPCEDEWQPGVPTPVRETLREAWALFHRPFLPPPPLSSLEAEVSCSIPPPHLSSPLASSSGPSPSALSS